MPRVTGSSITRMAWLKSNCKKQKTAERWTVPVTVDKEKKSLVVDKDSLRGLAPDFNRGEAVFERNTLKIVEINVFRNELLNF